MSRETFVFKSLIPASAKEVFRWHKRPGAFERLSPPWVDCKILSRQGGIENGAQVTLAISNGLITVKWTLEHKDYVEGKQFCDFQVEGPFAFWEQTHRVEPETENSCYLQDTVEYELPAGGLGDLAGGRIIHNELENLFKYRHRTLIQDLVYAHEANIRPIRVLVSGSTGLIGSALVPFLTSQGHEVARLLRPGTVVPDTDHNERIRWDPYEPKVDTRLLEGFDAVVHLAGDNIGSERWTDAKKKKMIYSRLKPTQFLCQALNSLNKPPAVLVAASAVGIYGDRGLEDLFEESPHGEGFLADTCIQWEAAARGVDTDVRLVNLRLGVVMTPKGGALQKMLLPFQMGGGGPIGTGQQFFSWIDIDDALGAIFHSIVNGKVSGPVNAVSPYPVQNADYARVLGKIIGRPAVVPMPAFAARAMFGQMADECLLASQKVLPVKLTETGYEFRYPYLEKSLRHVLGKFAD
ncbi:MAG: TIGR01777 family protein [Candidatus Melainabacteria bacterium]|nr:TIGR01777 family protein [Candidatus Melainabacteria bacterium]